MKKIVLFITLSGSIFSACNNSQQSINEGKVNKDDRPATTICYQSIHKLDTIRLSFLSRGDSVHGNLSYNYFEKDKNTGTIQGIWKGDTLFAKYRFLSEGVSSLREIAFLKKGNQLVEGYGKSRELNGEMNFLDHHLLQFNSSFPLTEIDCGIKGQF